MRILLPIIVFGLFKLLFLLFDNILFSLPLILLGWRRTNSHNFSSSVHDVKATSMTLCFAFIEGIEKLKGLQSHGSWRLVHINLNFFFTYRVSGGHFIIIIRRIIYPRFFLPDRGLRLSL